MKSEQQKMYLVIIDLNWIDNFHVRRTFPV